MLQVIEKMVRPERFELPTFWFVAQFCSTRRTKQTNGMRQSAESLLFTIVPVCLPLPSVYGQKADRGTFYHFCQ